jgi:zinc transporter ZupT
LAWEEPRDPQGSELTPSPLFQDLAIFDGVSNVREGEHASIHGHAHYNGQPGMCCDPVHVENGKMKVGETTVRFSPPEAHDAEAEIAMEADAGGSAEEKAIRVGMDGMSEHDKALTKMSLMTGVAIALHNFPEGLATFMAALADAKLGASIAIAIALHNIPEVSTASHLPCPEALPVMKGQYSRCLLPRAGSVCCDASVLCYG